MHKIMSRNPEKHLKALLFLTFPFPKSSRIAPEFREANFGIVGIIRESFRDSKGRNIKQFGKFGNLEKYIQGWWGNKYGKLQKKDKFWQIKVPYFVRNW